MNLPLLNAAWVLSFEHNGHRWITDRFAMWRADVLDLYLDLPDGVHNLDIEQELFATSSVNIDSVRRIFAQVDGNGWDPVEPSPWSFRHCGLRYAVWMWDGEPLAMRIEIADHLPDDVTLERRARPEHDQDAAACVRVLRDGEAVGLVMPLAECPPLPDFPLGGVS